VNSENSIWYRVYSEEKNKIQDERFTPHLNPPLEGGGDKKKKWFSACAGITE